jgi:SpoIID/LytB domain protein
MENGVVKPYVFESDISMDQLRTMFGAADIKNTIISSVNANNGVIKVDGRGYGHGVGLSQYGAQGRAKAGQDYKQILQFYYDGTVVK